MTSIPILSRKIITTTGEPDKWRFGITKYFADKIVDSDPTDEIFVLINGVEYNISFDVYNGISMAYPDYFYVINIGYDYYLEFINSGSYFTSYTIYEWIRFSSNLYDPQPNVIESLFEPQDVQPVYNPITFKFISDNRYNEGFRYIFSIYDPVETTKVIGRFKTAPNYDGTGYIDISKFLSNFVSVDFNPEINYNDDCKNSYIKWIYSIGEEYVYSVDFDTITSTTIDGIDYVTLNFLDVPDFVVGDYIEIKNNSNISVNGLHKIIYTSSNQITIGIKYSTLTSYNSGSVKYSDSRKKQFINVFSNDKKYFLSFNGVLSWVKELNEYDYKRYVSYDTEWLTNNNPRLLTSLRPANNLYYLTDYNQPFYINWLLNEEKTDFKYNYFIRTKTYSSDKTPYLQADSDFEDGLIPWRVRQARVDPSHYSMEIPEGGYWSFALYTRDIDEIEYIVSQEYWFKNDERCKITENIIQYMDRFGSILSFQFPLRVEQKGTITRNMTKQQQEFNITTGLVYDTLKGGTTINNVNMTRDFMLTTNWMSELDLALFEVLLTSPFTWYIIDGVSYSCQVQEKDFQVETQKNKKLIKKTITIRLAMDQTINI